MKSKPFASEGTMNIQTHAEICSIFCQFFGETSPASDTVMTIYKPVGESDATLHFNFIAHQGIDLDYRVGKHKVSACVVSLSMPKVWFTVYDEDALHILGQDTRGLTMTVTIKKDFTMEVGTSEALEHLVGKKWK